MQKKSGAAKKTMSKQDWKALEIASDQDKILCALDIILHNPQCPSGLYEAVAQFLCEQSSWCGDDIYHSPIFLGEILRTVKPNELMGAQLKARRSTGGAQ